MPIYRTSHHPNGGMIIMINEPIPPTEECKDYNWVLAQIDSMQKEIEQINLNIEYTMQIIECYANALIVIKETIESLHNFTFEKTDFDIHT